MYLPDAPYGELQWCDLKYTALYIIRNLGAEHSFDATAKFRHYLEWDDVAGWCYTIATDVTLLPVHTCTWRYYITVLCYISVPLNCWQYLWLFRQFICHCRLSFWMFSVHISRQSVKFKRRGGGDSKISMNSQFWDFRFKILVYLGFLKKSMATLIFRKVLEMFQEIFGVVTYLPLILSSLPYLRSLPPSITPSWNHFFDGSLGAPRRWSKPAVCTPMKGLPK